jgi:hypothetical protein
MLVVQHRPPSRSASSAAAYLAQQSRTQTPHHLLLTLLIIYQTSAPVCMPSRRSAPGLLFGPFSSPPALPFPAVLCLQATNEMGHASPTNNLVMQFYRWFLEGFKPAPRVQSMTLHPVETGETGAGATLVCADTAPSCPRRGKTSVLPPLKVLGSRIIVRPRWKFLHGPPFLGVRSGTIGRDFG